MGSGRGDDCGARGPWSRGGAQAATDVEFEDDFDLLPFAFFILSGARPGVPATGRPSGPVCVATMT